MPDYCLCTHNKCPLRSECLRAAENVAFVPPMWQAYSDFKDEVMQALDGSWQCEMFMQRKPVLDRKYDDKPFRNAAD